MSPYRLSIHVGLQQYKLATSETSPMTSPQRLNVPLWNETYSSFWLFLIDFAKSPKKQQVIASYFAYKKVRHKCLSCKRHRGGNRMDPDLKSYLSFKKTVIFNTGKGFKHYNIFNLNTVSRINVSESVMHACRFTTT